MQAQEVPPYAAPTGLGTPQTEEAYGGPEHAVGAEEQGHKKKSVIGKVKDKAKKLKTKIKKPKSQRVAGDNVNNNDESSSASSSDEEDSTGSDPHQEIGQRTGEERDVVSTPGLTGAAYEAIPDPHIGAAGGVQERFGKLRLGDELERTKLQEEVPSAPGQESAGVSPYLATNVLGQSTEDSRGVPMEEGKNTEGKDLLVTPAASDDKEVSPMDYEQPSDFSKTSDNTAAWYTPTSADSAPDAEQQKPMKDRIVENATAAKDTVAATAASGAGALGLASYANKDNTENRDTNVGENKPSITGRAAGTVIGLKDTIASKLGYGSNKNLTGEVDTPTSTTPTTPVDAQNPENKSVLQKIQERAAGATGAITSKLGYGEKQSPSEAVSRGVNPGDNKSGDNKSYTQKAYEAAYGAKDAVASKLGYGGTTPKDDVAVVTEGATEGDNKSYLQKAQETAVSAKDTVALKAQETAATAREVVGSKLGYPTTDTPAATTEGAYGADQNLPASTAARFHPGEEDRALSQLITEKMSTGAATVKDTLLRPFGATKSGPPTPTTTPPPSSATAVMADPEHTTVGGTTDVPHEERPGIVGKVTGAVSSLLGTSASGKKKAGEAAGKAVEDPQAQAPVVEM